MRAHSRLERTYAQNQRAERHLVVRNANRQQPGVPEPQWSTEAPWPSCQAKGNARGLPALVWEVGEGGALPGTSEAGAGDVWCGRAQVRGGKLRQNTVEL